MLTYAAAMLSSARIAGSSSMPGNRCDRGAGGRADDLRAPDGFAGAAAFFVAAFFLPTVARVGDLLFAFLAMRSLLLGGRIHDKDTRHAVERAPRDDPTLDKPRPAERLERAPRRREGAALRARAALHLDEHDP